MADNGIEQCTVICHRDRRDRLQRQLFEPQLECRHSHDGGDFYKYRTDDLHLYQMQRCGKTDYPRGGLC